MQLVDSVLFQLWDRHFIALSAFYYLLRREGDTLSGSVYKDVCHFDIEMSSLAETSFLIGSD